MQSLTYSHKFIFRVKKLAAQKEMNLTHKDIANILGVSLEGVRKVLKKPKRKEI